MIVLIAYFLSTLHPSNIIVQCCQIELLKVGHTVYFFFQIFQNEAMTGTHTQNPIYSRITMALMEDTGWYLPNYDMADDFKWGRNLSCAFALNSCLEWMETRQSQGLSIHPYCNKVKRDPLETECTDDRSSVALCNLVQHNNLLPSYFQVR